MKTSLGTLEITLYIAAWGAGIAASLYHYFIGQEELLVTNAIDVDLLPGLKGGWSAVQRVRDDSDPEWSMWKHYSQVFWLPIAAHFFISEVLQNNFENLTRCWYIFFSLIFTSIHFGFTQMLLIISQPLLYAIAVYLTRRRVWIWVTNIVILATLIYLKKNVLFWYMFQQDLIMEDIYLILTSLSWIQVRCISFSFDYIEKQTRVVENSRSTEDDASIKKCDAKTSYKIKDNNKVNNKTNKENMNSEIKDIFSENSLLSLITGILSYSLFLPTLFMGPLVSYSDFESSFIKKDKPSLSERVRRFAVDISIVIIYACLLEFTLHYIYFLAVKYEIGFVRMLRNSALCGAGLFMGLQFHLKYVVMYTAGGALAALHRAPAPPAPRCIMRVHRYSHMWRHFDVGLYRFLLKYMYKPALAALAPDGGPTAAHKLLAASATFSFVFLWHGPMLYILVWSALNFLGVAVESFGSFIGTTRSYSIFRDNVLKTPQAEERFLAAISVPMLAMSFISNVFFFAGFDVGRHFVGSLLAERWYNVLLVCACLHACCHGSAVLADVSSRTDRRRAKNILETDRKIL